MHKNVIDWLLEDETPAVRYRTQTELLGAEADNGAAKEWIYSKLPVKLGEENGLWFTYYLTSLAECGMKRSDVEPECIEKAVDMLTTAFECGCSDFMLLRALVMLGCGNEESVRRSIAEASERMLPDGGFLCLHRLGKLDYTPKSCYKANIFALMLASECMKSGIDCMFTDKLLGYFWNHNIFYRTDDKSMLILNSRSGWRTIDTFHPPEPMRAGLHNAVEAFSALGYGNDERLSEAWKLLNSHKDESGKVILDGTMTKSYLPKERLGKPSKWVTFYTLLAEKKKSNAEKR